MPGRHQAVGVQLGMGAATVETPRAKTQTCSVLTFTVLFVVIGYLAGRIKIVIKTNDQPSTNEAVCK